MIPGQTNQNQQNESKLDSSVRSFLDDWIAPDPQTEAKTKVLKLGQIKEMVIPEAWQASSDRPLGGTSMYAEFHPPDKAQVKLGFYYRGRRISKAAGATFRRILQYPDHVLSVQEFNVLEAVLQDKIDPADFVTLIAKTEWFNGKRVLVIEGRYQEIQEEHRSIIVDADGTGTVVQEIFYQAPREMYLQYYRCATLAMKSIIWRGSIL